MKMKKVQELAHNILMNTILLTTVALLGTGARFLYYAGDTVKNVDILVQQLNGEIPIEPGDEGLASFIYQTLAPLQGITAQLNNQLVKVTPYKMWELQNCCGGINMKYRAYCSVPDSDPIRDQVVTDPAARDRNQQFCAENLYGKKTYNVLTLMYREILGCYNRVKTNGGTMDIYVPTNLITQLEGSMRTCNQYLARDRNNFDLREYCRLVKIFHTHLAQFDAVAVYTERGQQPDIRKIFENLGSLSSTGSVAAIAGAAGASFGAGLGGSVVGPGGVVGGIVGALVSLFRSAS